jgi:hypothetical protein
MLKNIVVSSAVIVVSSALAAQAAVSFTGPVITENFDGMPTTTQTGFLAATKVTVPGTIFEAVDTDGAGSPPLTADDGSSNAGGIHSHGNAGSAERALGTIASASAIPAFGLEVINGGAFPMDSITYRFTQENWRSSTSTLNVINAAYFTGAAGIATYLTDTGFTDVNAIDLNGPAPVTSNGALDGNNAANQVSLFVTINFATPVPVGNSVYLRFTDANDVGNDAALAIDNFNVTGTFVVPEPTSLAALGLLGLVAGRRRA